MALPKLLVTVSSGRRCRVEYKESADAIAAMITWEGLDATPEDHAEAQAAALYAIEHRLHPEAQILAEDMGRDKAARDRAVKRFLKANEN